MLRRRAAHSDLEALLKSDPRDQIPLERIEIEYLIREYRDLVNQENELWHRLNPEMR